MNAPLFVTLRNGQTVSAKLYKGQPSAKTFANLTQAEREASNMRAAGFVADVVRWGRPFFVRIESKG